MDRRHNVSLLLRTEAAERLKLDSFPVSTWEKTVACQPQLIQLPFTSKSVLKKLQQCRNTVPNHKTSSSIRLAKTANKRVTKVPKLVFAPINSKRRRKQAISNQFKLEEDVNQGGRQINAGVYLVENKKTGHRYFGTTWDLLNAEAQTYHDLQRGVHPHHALTMCFQHCGPVASNIRFRVVEKVAPPPLKIQVSIDPVRAKRRRKRQLALGCDDDSDAFDVRAMERKLAARLRFHQQKLVRRVTYQLVRRFVVLPVLARAWLRWIQAKEGCEFTETFASAVEIQRLARGSLARNEVKSIRRQRAACLLQRFLRQSLFTLTCRRRSRLLREVKAAYIIQRSLREFVAQQKTRRIRTEVRRWLAARKVQNCIRRYQARRLVEGMKLMKARVTAAIRVQCVTRGYLTRLRVQRLRHIKAQGTLDKLRDEAARMIQQSYLHWKALLRRQQNAKANTIRLAYRNYIARKFAWVVITLLLENSMAKRIQRAAQRWMFRQGFRRLVTQLRREKALITLQSFTRCYEARKRVHLLRMKQIRAKAARKMQTFWRAYWLLFKLNERVATRKRERVARLIQSCYCAWKARREDVVRREFARRNDAAIKMQCMFRTRQARRELMRRQVVRRLGACENCRSQLAIVYHLQEERELCAACCAQFATLSDAMDTIELGVYRRLQLTLARAQRAYRSFQVRMVDKFGACCLCENFAVRRSCWTCLQGHGVDACKRKLAVGLTFCRSCDALLHERKQLTGTSSLLQHQRKEIERAYAEDAAAVTIQKYYRRFTQRNAVAELRSARQIAAATQIQGCYRRHRQRRITRAICAARRRQELLEVSAALTLQRTIRGHLARCELRRLRRARDSVMKIQCAWRRHQAHRVYFAAVAIQSLARGWLARRVAATLRQERLEQQRDAAARVIQRLARGFLGRRRAFHARQEAAAVFLQSVWRGYVARGKLLALKLERLQQFNAQLRARLTKLAAQIAEHERVAATRIQTMVRGRQARTELQHRKLRAARKEREMCRDRAVALETVSANCIQRHVRERLTNTASRQRLCAQCCARCYLSRRIVKRVRLQKQAAVRIQRAFRYSRAKLRLARLVVADDVADVAELGWVELFDETSGYVYYHHTGTGESVWERPSEMATLTWPEDESVGEWVEYWDENVGASYFYNVKTGEATWTTPTGYQSNNNQEDTATEALSKHQYVPYGYEDGGDEASQWGDDNGYYGDVAGSSYVVADNETEYDPVDSEYDINYKIYLTQIEREHEAQQSSDTEGFNGPKDA